MNNNALREELNTSNSEEISSMASNKRENITQDKQISLDDYLKCLNYHPNTLPEEIRNQENVDHPAHYNSDKYECIEVMREIFGDEAVKTWIRLNIFKYSWRSDKKNGDEDIAKIAWYANYYDKIK